MALSSQMQPAASPIGVVWAAGWGSFIFLVVPTAAYRTTPDSLQVETKATKKALAMVKQDQEEYGTAPVSKGPAVAPSFVIDLRRPPEERWSDVIAHFREPMAKVFKQMSDEILESIGSYGELMLRPITSLIFPSHIRAEVCGIAKAVGVSCNVLRIMQIAYELHAACTSVAAILPGGPQLFRTMDWDLQLLKRLSATFHFIGDGLNFTATSWAGYVGVLTGVRAAGPDWDGLALSVNFRRKVQEPLSIGVILEKVKNLVTLGEPVGFLLRRILGGRDFAMHNSAMFALETQPVVAPVYFTVVGVRPAIEKLLQLYAEDYDANYDAEELSCCCSFKGNECALVSKADLDSSIGSDDGCPIMTFDSNGPQMTVERRNGCSNVPTKIANCALQAVEAAIITRGLKAFEEVRRLTATMKQHGVCEPNLQGHRRFLVQTNHDQFAPIVDGEPVSPDGASQDIFDSLSRKRKADAYLKAMPSQLHETDVKEYAFSVLSLPKVMNSHTVYGTLMNPWSGDLETRLPGECIKPRRGSMPMCGDQSRTFVWRRV
mmetsp:Transcript_90014/g.178966  ORF Transcript_90014/g.178966 Transcript_90014/m.178966 type:complete len:546 (+) Transcript_90014:55-1692(+)